MSRALVTAVPNVGHSAALVLVSMALQAKDTDVRPAYFGGWEPLAIVLGYIDDPRSDRAHQAVKRAVRELVTLAYVETDGLRPRSWKRKYYLTLPDRPATVTASRAR